MPLTMVKGTSPGSALPPAAQRLTLARKGARCGAGAGSPRPHRPHPGHTGRGTPAARPRGQAAGGGTAPDTRPPSQRWQATPPEGRPPTTPTARSPHSACRPREPVLGPHTHTPAPTAQGWQTPTARPPGGQSEEGDHLASDAPHNGGGHPPGDTPPPPQQRATPARRGARCGAGAGSPRPHRPHPGHTGRGTPAARPRGRAAGGGTAPDTRRPSQRWRATLPGDGPPPSPGHEAPTGHAGQGDIVGPPHPHTRAHSTWVGDPNNPPSGWAVEGGGAPDLIRPSQRWKATPPGTPFRHPHREQRRPARAHAVGPLLGPHARINRTRGTRVAEPRLPAPEDGRLGEGQRLTPDAPHNGGRPTPPEGRPPTTPTARSPHRACRPRGQCWAPTPTRPHPQDLGGRPQQPTQWAGSSERGSASPQTPLTTVEGTPSGMPFRHPHSEQLRPARAHAVGLVLGPHTRTDRTRHTRAAEPRLPAPEDGRPGEGQRLTPDAPHNGGRPPPPGTAPHHPHGTQPPRGMQPKGTVLSPHTHTPAPTARGWRTPTARPVGGQSGEGKRPTSGAPHNVGRHPPPGMPFRHPHSEQRWPARAHAVGPVLGPRARTNRNPGHTGCGTPAARPRGRAAGGGTAPDIRRPSQRWQATPPGDGPPSPPRHAAPTGHAGQRDSVGPPHPHTRAHSTWVADPNSPPSGRAVRGGGAPDHRRPSQRWKAPPQGTPFRHPHSEQRQPARAHTVGPVLGPTPAPTAPGTHGSRNPGCPPQRTGGRGRDSA